MGGKVMLRFRNVIIFLAMILLGTGMLFVSQRTITADNLETEVYFNNTPMFDQNISDKLIRFHVIANSDSDSDQSIKLEIRDAILKEFGQSLSKCKTREESLKYIKSRLPEIEGLADEILSEGGKNYKAKAFLGEFKFPIKSYGTITLPPGEYTALKVILGDGGGKNWWCVMFPPLCFIDITRGLTSEETDKSLGKVLNKNEIREITQDNNKTSNTLQANKNIKFKFKSVEIIKKLIGRL